jgi:hypothetical protein
MRIRHAEEHCQLMRQEAMRQGAIYVVSDWKMKWVPTNWDETAKKWFGKQGLLWHGHAISIPKAVWDASPDIARILENNPCVNVIEPMTDGSYLVYCHDVFQNDRKTDGASTLSSIESLVRQLQAWFPSCDSWVLQTDNGPCYKGNVFAHGLKRLNEIYTLKLRAFINTGVQDGKTYLDGHFGVMTQGLIRKMVMFKSMNSPDTLVNALVLLAPKNCIIRMITVDHLAVRKIAREDEDLKSYDKSFAIPHVKDLRHLEFSEGTWIGYRHAYVPSSDVGAIPVCPPWTTTTPDTIVNPTATVRLGLDHVVLSRIQRSSIRGSRNFREASFNISHTRGMRATMDHALQYAAKALAEGRHFQTAATIKSMELTTNPDTTDLGQLYKSGWALMDPSGMPFSIEHQSICAAMFVEDMRFPTRSRCSFATCKEAIVAAIQSGEVRGPPPTDSKVTDLIQRMCVSRDSLLKSLAANDFSMDDLLFSQSITELASIAMSEKILLGSSRVSEPDSIRDSILAKYRLSFIGEGDDLVFVTQLRVGEIRDVLERVFLCAPFTVAKLKVGELRDMLMREATGSMKETVSENAGAYESALNGEETINDRRSAIDEDGDCLVKKIKDAVESFHTRALVKIDKKAKRKRGRVSSTQNRYGKDPLLHDTNYADAASAVVEAGEMNVIDDAALSAVSVAPATCSAVVEAGEMNVIYGSASSAVSVAPATSSAVVEAGEMNVIDDAALSAVSVAPATSSAVVEAVDTMNCIINLESLAMVTLPSRLTRSGSLLSESPEDLPSGVTCTRVRKRGAPSPPGSAEKLKPERKKARKRSATVLKFHSSVIDTKEIRDICIRVTNMPITKRLLGSLWDCEDFMFNDFLSARKRGADGNLVINGWKYKFSISKHLFCALFTDGFVYGCTIVSAEDDTGILNVRFLDGDTSTVSLHDIAEFWKVGDAISACWIDTSAKGEASSGWYAARIVSVDDAESGFIIVRYAADGIVHRVHISDCRQKAFRDVKK